MGSKKEQIVAFLDRDAAIISYHARVRMFERNIRLISIRS